MVNQFQMDSIPGSLLIIGGRHETWYDSVSLTGWKVEHCTDLRQGQSMIERIGPCVGLVDLTRDNFSLSAIAHLANNNKHVRWMAYIDDHQLNQDPICQFIVNYCTDFFSAPMPIKLLLSSIGHQLGMLKLEKKVWPDCVMDKQARLVGDSLSMKRLREQIQRIAPTDTSVIISGERGVGKSLVAKLVHDASTRNKAPFVVVCASALSEKRFEKEVFGFDRESHQTDFITKLEEAHEGTLLIKDIGALPLSQQNHLLQFIHYPTISTVHGEKNINTRIIATTYNDLEQSVKDKDFSSELLSLLKILKINMTPLKDRASDISALANYYLVQFSREYSSQVRSISRQALTMLVQYHWPGNVRELVNQMKRAVLMCEGTILEPDHFDLPTQNQHVRSLKVIRENSEREALIQALDTYHGQVALAAKELKISRATMYRLLSKYKIIAD